jgi:hypothetical protein
MPESTVKVAAVQAAPVFLDLEARVAKALALIEEAVATWSWCSAGMVWRMTWMTSGVNSGYRTAWSMPNGRWPRPRHRRSLPAGVGR